MGLVSGFRGWGALGFCLGAHHGQGRPNLGFRVSGLGLGG